jgi:hypothetical protein
MIFKLGLVLSTIICLDMYLQAMSPDAATYVDKYGRKVCRYISKYARR